MKISIAMAAYNGGAYLAEQLASFLAQTRQPDQLVIVDDASSDDTIDIAKSFAATAPFDVVILANEKNMGYAQAFGSALARCSGDLVFLSDQDDVWFAEKIETIAAYAASEDGIGCFINDAMLTDSRLVPSTFTKAAQIRSAGLPESLFVMGCCVAVRRALLDIVLPIPQGSRSHDDWLVGLSDCLQLTRRVPDVLQFYRRHGNNASNIYVNTIHRIGRARRAREYFRRLLRRITTTNALERELRYYTQLTRRLDQRREACIALVGAHRLSACADSVALRHDTLSRRSAIRRLPTIQRLQPVAGLWRRGGYRISGGTSGAIKDVLAVRHRTAMD